MCRRCKLRMSDEVKREVFGQCFDPSEDITFDKTLYKRNQEEYL
jgi:hypothetical protein